MIRRTVTPTHVTVVMTSREFDMLKLMYRIGLEQVRRTTDESSTAYNSVVLGQALDRELFRRRHTPPRGVTPSPSPA